MDAGITLNSPIVAFKNTAYQKDLKEQRVHYLYTILIHTQGRYFEIYLHFVK